MKKILAILLLLIHALNICGVQLFFSFAEKLADRQMVASLDENRYDEHDLIQVKLPLNIPYTTDWKDYERCDGNIVLNGVHYNYVKRIVSNDTMYLYCIPNLQKTELNDTKSEYAKLSTDLPSNKKTDQSTAKRNTLTNEYNFGPILYNFSALLNSAGELSAFNNNSTSTGFITLPIQPPDLAA